MLGQEIEFIFEEKGLAAADVDRNGKINSIDFAHMRIYLLGKATLPPLLPE